MDHAGDVGPVVRRFDSKVFASSEAVDWMKYYFDLEEERFVRTEHRKTYELETGEKLTALWGRHIDVDAVFRRQYKQVSGQDADTNWAPEEVSQNLMALARRWPQQQT